MKNLKTISKIVGGFVAGVVTTLVVLYIIVLPNIAKEIGIFANESAMRAYEVGYSDGENNTDNFNYWFNDETIEAVKNYEYKFIK